MVRPIVRFGARRKARVRVRLKVRVRLRLKVRVRVRAINGRREPAQVIWLKRVLGRGDK